MLEKKLSGRQTNFLELPIEASQPVIRLQRTQTNSLKGATQVSQSVAPRATKKKQKQPLEHRTAAGQVCSGNIQIPGLDYSRCDTCHEWIPTSKWDVKD